MSEATTCEVPTADWSALDGTFDEVSAAFAQDAMWVRFFGVRPCCPAPGADSAREHVSELKRRIEAKEGLSADERAALSAVADERLDWYIRTFAVKSPAIVK